MDSLVRTTNFVETENGAIAHKTTLNKVYDMFALGGAYRNRTDAIFICSISICSP